MSLVVRVAFVAMVVIAVLPALLAHRPPPQRVAAVGSARRTGARFRLGARNGVGGRGPPPIHAPWVSGARRGPAWHRAGRAVAVAVAAGVVGMIGAAVLVGTVVGVRCARVKAAQRRHETALAADLPEVADLLVVAAAAGLTVPLAIEAVGRRGTGPLARKLAEVGAEAAAGRRLADVLDELPTRAGELSRPLAGALLACLRDGAPALATLASLAGEAREHERRRVEQAARRLPVLLLFPLVLCVLPAFALLTVAPLIADALAALRL